MSISGRSIALGWPWAGADHTHPPDVVDEQVQARFAAVRAVRLLGAMGGMERPDQCPGQTDAGGTEEDVDRRDEPPRDFRRLQLLRDWSHDEAYPTLLP